MLMGFHFSLGNIALLTECLPLAQKSKSIEQQGDPNRCFPKLSSLFCYYFLNLHLPWGAGN